MELSIPLPGHYSIICFSFDPGGSELIFKTGNLMIQRGNGIISPTSRPLIKKTSFKNTSHMIQMIQN